MFYDAEMEPWHGDGLTLARNTAHIKTKTKSSFGTRSCAASGHDKASSRRPEQRQRLDGFKRDPLITVLHSCRDRRTVHPGVRPAQPSERCHGLHPHPSIAVLQTRRDCHHVRSPSLAPAATRTAAQRTNSLTAMLHRGKMPGPTHSPLSVVMAVRRVRTSSSLSRPAIAEACGPARWPRQCSVSTAADLTRASLCSSLAIRCCQTASNLSPAFFFLFFLNACQFWGCSRWQCRQWLLQPADDHCQVCRSEVCSQLGNCSHHRCPYSGVAVLQPRRNGLHMQLT